MSVIKKHADRQIFNFLEEKVVEQMICLFGCELSKNKCNHEKQREANSSERRKVAKIRKEARESVSKSNLRDQKFQQKESCIRILNKGHESLVFKKQACGGPWNGPMSGPLALSKQIKF